MPRRVEAIHSHRLAPMGPKKATSATVSKGSRKRLHQMRLAAEDAISLKQGVAPARGTPKSKRATDQTLCDPFYQATDTRPKLNNLNASEAAQEQLLRGGSLLLERREFPQEQPRSLSREVTLPINILTDVSGEPKISRRSPISEGGEFTERGSPSGRYDTWGRQVAADRLSGETPSGSLLRMNLSEITDYRSQL